MRVHCLYRGGYASNCYLVTDSEGSHGVIIDPSAPIPSELLKTTAVDAILLTHGHYDHMLRLADWKAATDAPIFIGRADAAFLTDPALNVSSLFGTAYVGPTPDKLLDEGDVISFGTDQLTVLQTPGHTPGGLCYYGDGMLFCGDTVFADGGLGRTDLPGGSFSSLLTSRKRIFSLPEDTILYPGHGRTTVIAQETSGGF